MPESVHCEFALSPNDQDARNTRSMCKWDLSVIIVEPAFPTKMEIVNKNRAVFSVALRSRSQPAVEICGFTGWNLRSMVRFAVPRRSRLCGAVAKNCRFQNYVAAAFH